MDRETALIVQIRIQHLDGVYYAASADVPGLHVCGGTAEQAIESSLKAVKALFKTNRGLEVRVLPASDDVDAFPRSTGPIEHLVVQRAA